LQRLRVWKKARRVRPGRAVDEAIAQAHRAEAQGRASLAAACVDRAVHLAIERATGLRARGILIDEIESALAQRGVGADLATRVRNVLASVDAARFRPDFEGASAGMSGRAADVIADLGRMPSWKGSSA